MLAALGSRERLITRLAIFEVMRPSEILGLQRQDVDDDSVWVRRRIFKSNVDTPKTHRSARRVALSLGTKDLLDSWISNLASESPDFGYSQRKH
jgi:integrase